MIRSPSNVVLHSIVLPCFIVRIFFVFVLACSTSLLYIQSRVLITVSQARKAQLALIGSDNDCIVMFLFLSLILSTGLNCYWVIAFHFFFTYSLVIYTVSQARKATAIGWIWCWLFFCRFSTICCDLVDIVVLTELLLHSSFHYIQAHDLYCYTGHKGPACQLVLVMFVVVIFHCWYLLYRF